MAEICHSIEHNSHGVHVTISRLLLLTVDNFWCYVAILNCVLMFFMCTLTIKLCLRYCSCLAEINDYNMIAIITGDENVTGCDIVV